MMDDEPPSAVQLRAEIDKLQALEKVALEGEDALVKAFGSILSVRESQKQVLRRCYELFAQIAAEITERKAQTK